MRIEAQKGVCIVVFDTVLLKAIIKDSSGVCKAGMGVKLRGSKLRDTGVGDPAMEVILGVPR